MLMILKIVMYLGFAIFELFHNSNLIIPEYSNSNLIRYNIKGKNAIEISINSLNDTTKTSDSIGPIVIYYVIAGSFLVPKNAETQVQKLKLLGFKKCYKYNFPDTEYYSAVVDTFKLESEYIELTEKLQKMNIEYFIKN